jgi:hypothetical protein
MFLSVCLVDKIMGCTRIKVNDNWVTVEGECTHEDMSALENILHGGVVHSSGHGSNNSQRMVGMTLRSRCINLPRCHTLLTKMTNMTTIVAGVGNYAQLMWLWAWHSRWGYHSSRHDVLILRWIGSQMMMLRLWVVTWGTHHPVFGRSTTRGGCQSLLLLAFPVSTDCVICDDDIAH